MELGFIGLGLMGRPLAQHLANAGHHLHLWARRTASLQEFQDGSATIHSSPQELARAVQIMFTMVADSADVSAVILGEQGLGSGARPDSVIVDMSTISPPTARNIAKLLAAQAVEFLDAPVSGGATGAQKATLTIMVGGTERAYTRVYPLLQLMGTSITHVGASGAGQVAKACNQILTGVQVAAVAEALNFACASGVDPARVRQALLGGFAASRTLEVHGQRMLQGDFQPGFKAWMHQKDLHIVLGEAQRLGIPVTTTAAAAQLLNILVGSGGGEDDSVALFRLLRELNLPRTAPAVGQAPAVS